MFSSNELITFVFANEGDTYYRDDLQKLELEQHLWYLLHESFDAVYFLREEDQQLTVDSFGDRKGSCPELKKSIFSSVEKQLRSWIPKALRRTPGEKGTAFVCRLQDFCNVMSQPQWEKTLREIKKLQDRSGIFVLIAPATAEKTTGLLLTSPVFEYLEETAITNLRGGELREMYDTLSKQKWGSCFFLNGFTPENVRGLLLHVAMEKPTRLESMEQLDKLSNTLYNLLNNPGNFSLFTFPLPGKYLMFSQLYKSLQKDEVWDRLVECCRSDICSCLERTCVPVLREINSCANRCLQLKLPRNLQGDDAAENLLREIQTLISVPKNREENAELLEQENYFYNCIGTVSSDDRETYITILRALKFCAGQVYMPPTAEKLELVREITEDYKSVIQASRNCYQMQQTLENSQPDSDYELANKIKAHNLEQTRKNLYIHRTIVEGTNAAILEATQKLNSPSVVEIKEILEKYRETKERNAKNAEATPEPTELAELTTPKKSEKKKQKDAPQKDTAPKAPPELDTGAFEGMSKAEKVKAINKIRPPVGL